jgi:hypothetical protein
MLTWAIGPKQESPRWVVWRRAHVRLVAPLTDINSLRMCDSTGGADTLERAAASHA